MMSVARTVFVGILATAYAVTTEIFDDGFVGMIRRDRSTDVESVENMSVLGKLIFSMLKDVSINSDDHALANVLPVLKGMDLKLWAKNALPRIPVLQPVGTVKPLDHVLQQNMVAADGLWLEFGVFTGGSINTIAKHAPQGKVVYGFDSFVGLPEDFTLRHDAPSNASAQPGAGRAVEERLAKNLFDLGGEPPKVEPNVALVKGWFNESLPEFLRWHPGEPVSLLHVDSDLYSSAKVVLDALKDRIRPGTVIVFDELVNFPAYEHQELKSLFELMQTRELHAEWIGSMCPVQLEPSNNPKDWGPCCAVALRILP